jgi:hypothetical protein
MNATKQAKHALNVLRFLRDIELGYDTQNARELSEDEKNVREAALTALLHYFVNDPGKPAPVE